MLAQAKTHDQALGTETYHRATTDGGVDVLCHRQRVEGAQLLAELTTSLDSRRGLLLSSGYEVPGRYGRYDIGFVDPPLSLSARGRDFELTALSRRGRPLLSAFERVLSAAPELSQLSRDDDRLTGFVAAGEAGFSEEQRTRQPTVLSVVRRIGEAMRCKDDAAIAHLGLYGAFGYDLVFQLDDLRMRMERGEAERDLVLYLPDRVIVRDRQRGIDERLSFEFTFEGESTEGLPRDGAHSPFVPSDVGAGEVVRDHAPGEYADEVRRAKRAFSAGDLFEVTPGQSFTTACPRSPSSLFAQLAEENPAPFGFLANLGQGEYLVGASPEMFVRVRGRRVETCPIAGTIARGADALGDADRILELLSSDKAVSELTMCTDVDRNDKARICEPGSVRVIGRRQIELYSRLIHTVDHVEGTLREGFDALDALATHCWAVTVTGAPKQAAMQFIEDHEASPRRFYGGAIGCVGFDGSLNTGLTIRTIHIEGGEATVRAGATLLHASDPDEEDRECGLKASALMSVLGCERRGTPPPPVRASVRRGAPARRRVLLVDHRDSFVHTLGDYFRQVGAEVTTLRAGFDPQAYARLRPELVVLSPGPGRPDDFDTRATLDQALQHRVPVFGVCLGLQAVVEYFGGELATLETPQHGRVSQVDCERDGHAGLFDGLPARFEVGRYHSLVAAGGVVPDALEVTARAADDGCVMALRHRELPMSAVQFHPESIMSASGGHGLRLIDNVVRGL